MKTEEKKYGLFGEYWMSDFTTTSFSKAREHFASLYTGRYTIKCYIDNTEKNVRL